MAYSLKITDPRFDQYLKNRRDYRYQFGFFLATAAVLGFYLYGEFSDEIDNPEALHIGLGLGGMFVLIGFYVAFAGKKNLPTWDGEVSGKKILNRHGRIYYVVYFEGQNNHKHEISTEDDTTLYDYYKIGEKVRFHGKLMSIEKFDKSNDDIIFCNACAFMNDANEDICRNCGCPLLK